VPFRETSVQLLQIIEHGHVMDMQLDAVSRDAQKLLNSKNCREIRKVWVRPLIENTDADTKETTPEIRNTNNEDATLDTLMEFVLLAKGLYYMMTGRSDLPSVSDIKKIVADVKGIRYFGKFDLDAEMQKKYEYEHEHKTNYELHVKELLISLEKLPKSIMLLGEKIGPFFEDYIPLFLERRIRFQPSAQTTPVANSGSPAYMLDYMINLFSDSSIWLQDEMSIVVDFKLRQLQSDRDISDAMDCLIENLRRFKHIKAKVLSKMDSFCIRDDHMPRANAPYSDPDAHDVRSTSHVAPYGAQNTAYGAQTTAYGSPSYASSYRTAI